MLRKMERKILAGLLAVSMCVTCIPTGMGQVRAEEGVESAATLTEQPDAVPEAAEEALTDADEPVTAPTPEGTQAPEVDASEKVEEVEEPEAIPEAAGETLTDMDEPVTAQTPEGTQAPEADASEETEEVEEPEADASKKAEEAEVDEEKIYNYDASAVNEVIPETEYRLDGVIDETFMFSPEKSGVYYLERVLENNRHCNVIISCKDGETNSYALMEPFIRAEKGKQYEIILYSSYEVTGTWALRELHPQEIELGQTFTHASDDYAYYTFTTGEAGTYHMNVWGEDEGRFSALIQEKGGDFTESRSIKNYYDDLKENTQYEIVFSTDAAVKSISAYLDREKDVLVSENEEQYTSLESTNKYKFQPDKDGVYFIEADLGENGKYPDFSCYGNDGYAIDIRYNYDRGSDNRYMYESVFRLEQGQTYTLSWYEVGEEGITWKIYRLDPKPVVAGEQYEYTHDAHVYYQFKPNKSVNHELYVFDNTDVTVLTIPGQNEYYYWSTNSPQQLDEGTEYSFVFSRIQAGSSVLWRMNQEETITVKENEEYCETDSALKAYTFTPDEGGFYYVEVESDGANNNFPWLSCHREGEPYEESYVEVTKLTNWQDGQLNCGYLLQLGGKTTYKLDWGSLEEDIKWKIYRLNPKTVELEEKINHTFGSPAYYTFAPKDAGLYKASFLDDDCSFRVQVLNKEYEYSNPFSSKQQLEGGVPYEFIIYGGQSGSSASWQMDKVREIPAEEGTEYHDTDGAPKQYTITPDKDGVYFIEANVGEYSWRNRFSCCDDKGGFVTFNSNHYWNQDSWNYVSVFRLEQQKKYTISWDELSEDGVTWKIFRLDPKQVVPGEKYDYSYDGHVYYQFKPTETDLYEIHAFGGKHLEILAIPDQTGNYPYNWYLDNPRQLEGKKEYEFVLYSMQAKDPVSWQINQREEITLKENEDYHETDTALKQYIFKPSEDGVYLVNAILGKRDTYDSYFNCHCDDDDTYVDIKSTTYWRDGKRYYGSVLRVEKNKTYRLEWDRVGEQGMHWSISRLNPKTVVPGEEITRTFNDPVYYTFTPKETGRYKMHLIDSDYSFDIIGINNMYGNNMFDSSRELEAGVPYEFVFYDGQSEDSVSWQMDKVEELTAEEDTEYHESMETPKMYRIKPKESGIYYLEADYNRQEYNPRFYCYCEDDGSYVSYDQRNKWSGRKNHTMSVLQLEGGKTYRFEWERVKESEVSWKIFRLDPKKIGSDETYSHKYGDHVYYQFTPKEPGYYSLRLDNDSDFGIIPLNETSGNNSPYWSINDLLLLEGKTSYDFVIYGGDLDSSVSWQMHTVEEVDVKEGEDYTETAELPKLYTFKPDKDGVYYLEADLNGQDITPQFSCYCTTDSRSVNQTYGSTSYIQVEKGKEYKIEWSNVGKKGITWKIYQMNQDTEKILSGKEYTYVHDKHVYYRFTPEETGYYILRLNDGSEFITALLKGSSGDTYAYWSINGLMKLEANTSYDFIIYGGRSGSSVSWQMNKVEEVTLKENTDYTETAELPKLYTFKPDKDGVYYVEADLNDQSITPRFSCYCITDSKWVNQTYGSASYIKVEGGKEYKIEWSNVGEKGITWKFYRLGQSTEKILPGKEYTYVHDDHVYYRFTPEETGLYRLHLNDKNEFRTALLNKSSGDTSVYWSIHDFMQLEANVPYDFIIYGGHSGSSVSWQMNKVEEIAVKENTDYSETDSAPKPYSFKPDEDGIYYVETDLQNQSYNLEFARYCIEDWTHVISGGNINHFIWAEGGKEYKLEWKNVGEKGLTWKIYRLNQSTEEILPGKQYTYTHDKHSYYTFTPEETGSYKLFIKNNSGFRARLIDTTTENVLDISYDYYELKKGRQYEIVFLDMHSGDSASWVLKKREEVKVEQNKEYTETPELLHKYIFTPDETGTYMLKMVCPENKNISFEYAENQGKYINWSEMYIYPSMRYETMSSQICYINLTGKETYELQFSSYSYGSGIELSEIEHTWSIRKVSDIPLDLGKTYTHSTGDAICYKFKPTEDGLYQLSHDSAVEYRVYDENKGSRCGFEIASTGYDVYSLKAGTEYTIYMSERYYEESEVENCTMQMTKMSAQKIEKADTSYKKEANKPGYYTFTANKAGKYVVEGLIKTDTLGWFDPERYITFDYGTNRSVVSLNENETIVLLVAGDSEEICVESVKESSDGLEYVSQIDGTIAIVGYKGSKEEIVIPEKIDGSNVTSIEGRVFEKSVVTSVKLPSRLTSIGYAAFAGSQLADIVIPDSVRSIGAEAFATCNALKKVTLGTGVEVIRDGLFYNCEALEEIAIPGNANITRIEYWAFSGCTSLSKMALPDTIESCGNNAFGDNDENYTAWYKKLPDGEVYIGKVLYAYKGTAPEGTKVSIKPGTVSVNEYAYKGQTGVSEVILPNGLKEIGWSAFVCGKNMKSIAIPSSVTYIASYAVGYEVEWESNSQYYTYKKLDDFVIYGQKGSAAETYATENGFEFVEKVMSLKGDVDLSGKVDISDLRMMLRAVCSKVTLTAEQVQAGDITGKNDMPDGTVNIADLRKLLRFICRKIETL